MNRTKTLLATAAVAMSPLILPSAPAHADDRTCRSSIGTVFVDGSVIVPAGATCTLNGTRVDDNVLVKAGAKLVMRGGRAGGSIQAEDARRVEVLPRDGARTRVGGSIQLVNGRNGGEIRWASVNGDVQLFSNDGTFVVRRNIIGGNLQCKDNDPRPTGGANQVEGNKEDQCRGL